MPVLLPDAEEIEAWTSAPWAEAAALQCPQPDGALAIVARGERRDPPGTGRGGA